MDKGGAKTKRGYPGPKRVCHKCITLVNHLGLQHIGHDAEHHVARPRQLQRVIPKNRSSSSQYWHQDRVKYVSICIAHFTAMPQMRSDMEDTVLPANYTMPAFTPQPQNITALWLVLILPSHRG